MDYKKGVFKLCQRMRLVSIEKESVKLQAKYGPSKVVEVPLNISEDLCCFSALIIGDGHLSKYKFITTIECSNLKLLKIMSSMIFSLFKIKTSVKKIKIREGKMQTYHLSIYSKAVQELLSTVFNIPRGKKSNSVRVPKLILKGEKRLYGSFIIGLLAAEGSRKGNQKVRICSASKQLLKDIQIMLKKLAISSSINSWINQKYKKEYYGISFKRKELDSLMRGCRSGQTGQILSIFKRIIGDHA